MSFFENWAQQKWRKACFSCRFRAQLLIQLQKWSTRAGLFVEIADKFIKLNFAKSQLTYYHCINANSPTNEAVNPVPRIESNLKKKTTHEFNLASDFSRFNKIEIHMEDLANLRSKIKQDVNLQEAHFLRFSNIYIYLFFKSSNLQDFARFTLKYHFLVMTWFLIQFLTLISNKVTTVWMY